MLFFLFSFSLVLFDTFENEEKERRVASEIFRVFFFDNSRRSCILVVRTVIRPTPCTYNYAFALTHNYIFECFIIIIMIIILFLNKAIKHKRKRDFVICFIY